MRAGLLSRPVTIRHRALQPTGAYGEDQPAPIGDIAALGYFEPRPGSELLTAEDLTKMPAVLYLQAGTAIDQRDQVLVDGAVYEVTSVERWSNPRTNSENHVRCLLEHERG